MAWYRTGTISLSNGSTAVTGVGTAWIANAAVGEALYAPDGRLYEIVAIVSNTSLTLGSAYLGTNVSGQSYVIVPSQSYIRDLAAQAAELVNNYSTIYNTVGQGKFLDGTVSAPAITFASDLDTGFYRSASNEVTFVANGTAQFKFNSSGVTFLNSITAVDLSLTGSNTIGDSATGDTQTLNGSTVINANSSSAGLRITQTGTGNALLVEDSTNPDSTPFVIDTNGNVIQGSTSPVTGVSSITNFIQSNSTSGAAGFSASRWVASNADSSIQLLKSRGASVGTYSPVASGDNLGQLSWGGDDGTAFIPAASIRAAVDGTPGTNDMPGRLVFSTTADGASSPTERMRIDSAGRVGIGASPFAGRSFLNYKTLTGSVNSIQNESYYTISSDVTGSVSTYLSGPTTQAASFTLGILRHFYASPQSFGAGSTVNSQTGFSAESTLTGATNNYGFYSNIAAGTGRWNFYAAGTADNYFAGNVGIGGSAAMGSGLLSIQKSLTGATSGWAVSAVPQVLSDVTVGAGMFSTYPSTQAAAFTLPTLTHFQAAQGTIGAGSTVTNQNGFLANGSLTGATNNYGFISSIAAGTGRWNFYAGGTADNFMAGRLGLGSTASAGTTLSLAMQMTGGATAYGELNQGIIQSDVTSQGIYNRAFGQTAAASFTLANLYYYQAVQGTFGAGSTVTNQYGFTAGSALTGATNNYGFYSQIAAGTGRWNFYAAGTADNFFAGGIGIGTWPGGYKLVSAPITYNSSQNAPYLIAATTSFTGAATNWGTYGFQHRIKTDGVGIPRITIDAPQAGVATELYSINGNGNAAYYAQPINYFGLYLAKPLTGSTSSYGLVNNGTIKSDVTNTASYFETGANTEAAAFTLGNIRHYTAGQNAIGAGSSVTNQYAFWVPGSLTGATNNYGFYSQIASGTGRYNFYAAGTADNYFAGSVGIGSVPSAGYNIFNGKTLTGSVAPVAQINLGAIQSDATASATMYQSQPSTAAASFTLPYLYHFRAYQGTFGAGSAVTNQYGFNVDGTLTGATNNYGFYSAIASGTGRWNFYAGGTAQNYFGGSVLFATTDGAGIKTGTAAGFFIENPGGYTTLWSSRTPTTAQTHIIFVNGNGQAGSIITNGTATAYNTSSDYRLKNVDGPIVNSGAYIDALRPVQGTWKTDGSRFIGLIAHEVQAVSETPVASGEKDGTEMQSMDYSSPEIIANMIAELQSLRVRVAQLEGA